MGIYGVGVDLVKTARLRQSYCAYGDRFLKRYLHPKEIAHFQALLADDSVQGVTNQTQFLASRWAVKEATLKAFKSWRILFPDVYVDKQCAVVPLHVTALPGLPPRKASPVVPVLAFDGATQSLASALAIQRTHVTISHDGDYTLATVVLET